MKRMVNNMKMNTKNVFPTIGNFLSGFSNDWKLFICFFQPLETFCRFFPMIGNFSSVFSNHWKSAVFAFGITAITIQAAPLPGFRYCGQVVDEDGKPYAGDAGAVIVMNVDDQEIHRCKLLLKPVKGCNYELEAPLFSGRDAYRKFAVQKGAVPNFYLLDGNQAKVLHAVDGIPPVGAPGAVARVDFWTGDDSDHDGLSDVFEQRIKDCCGGMFADISEIDPEADADGDGFSNREEFIAGTDATWNRDFFHADEAAIVNGSWMRLTFDTMPGKMYHVWSAEVPGSWSLADVARFPDGAISSDGVVGVGSDMSLYVPMTNGASFFKITVE